jgi:uncharacterized repeat protein (TIGR03803 family)
MTHRVSLTLQALCLTLLSVILPAVAALPAASQTFTSLYNFGSGVNYQGPAGPMVIGSDGSLYGVTVFGGLGYGTVFQLAPPSVPGGTWTETVLYSFKGGVDGYSPAEGLAADKAGNLYGSTLYGGVTGGCNCGLVFKLKPPAAPGGAWSKRTMHAFSGTNGDGVNCCAPLYVDTKGVVYGTTFNNSLNGQTVVGGTAFRLQSQGGGFVETILHTFGLTPEDGQLPETQLTADQAGNLYGTTYQGGAYGFGLVYKLSPPANSGDPWTQTILYNFRYGTTPSSVLVMGASGQLFGTSSDGGIDNEGTVYRLTPPSGGQTEWSRTALWSFLGAGNGSSPGGLALDRATGIFYGVTAYSSQGGGCGVAYQLAPPAVAGGAWQYTVLHAFSEAEGCLPTGPLIRASDGTLYGVTETMAYQIKP